MTNRFGYISILGRPNAGKSTLFNVLLDRKMAAVSNKPQTTRSTLYGVRCMDDTQMVFLDTPGLQYNSKGLPVLHQRMNRLAWASLAQEQIVCYLIRSTVGFHKEDELFLKRICEHKPSLVYIFLAQYDLIPGENRAQNLMQLQSQVDQLSLSEKIHPSVMPLSVYDQGSIEECLLQMRGSIPIAPWQYAQGHHVPEQVVASELLREQLFQKLDQELPYTSEIEVFSLKNTGRCLFVEAQILVLKENHKPIIIGAGGEKIKRMGTDARKWMEKTFNKKVHLNLHVKTISSRRLPFEFNCIFRVNRNQRNPQRSPCGSGC